MAKSNIIIPDWIKDKINANDQKFTDNEFTALSYYYKQLTNKKLKRSCVNCIPDAFIVIKIHLKNQKK